jgi:hypothetical protein
MKVGKIEIRIFLVLGVVAMEPSLARAELQRPRLVYGKGHALTATSDSCEDLGELPELVAEAKENARKAADQLCAPEKAGPTQGMWLVNVTCHHKSVYTIPRIDVSAERVFPCLSK